MVGTSYYCYHQLASPPGIFQLPLTWPWLQLSSSPAHLSPSISHPFSSFPLFLSSPLSIPILFLQLNPVSCSLPPLRPSSAFGLGPYQPNLNSFSAPAARETFFSPTWNRLNSNIPISSSHYHCYHYTPVLLEFLTVYLFWPRTLTLTFFNFLLVFFHLRPRLRSTSFP